MDYFNLLDTQVSPPDAHTGVGTGPDVVCGGFQIRHFLPPHIHELFQRKLRDRALQEMPTFRWCSHVSLSNAWTHVHVHVLRRLTGVCACLPACVSVLLRGAP